MWLIGDHGVGFRVHGSGFEAQMQTVASLKPSMKRHVAGTVNILNVEHRTSNIERPILMALRFFDLETNESR
jgi:hypothetical protein